MADPTREALAAAEIGLANLLSYQPRVGWPSTSEVSQARRALDAVRAALAAAPVSAAAAEPNWQKGELGAQAAFPSRAKHDGQLVRELQERIRALEADCDFYSQQALAAPSAAPVPQPQGEAPQQEAAPVVQGFAALVLDYIAKSDETSRILAAPFANPATGIATVPIPQRAQAAFGEAMRARDALLAALAAASPQEDDSDDLLTIAYLSGAADERRRAAAAASPPATPKVLDAAMAVVSWLDHASFDSSRLPDDTEIGEGSMVADLRALRQALIDFADAPAPVQPVQPVESDSLGGSSVGASASPTGLSAPAPDGASASIPGANTAQQQKEG
jgi:hypothetical protein